MKSRLAMDKNIYQGGLVLVQTPIGTIQGPLTFAFGSKSQNQPKKFWVASTRFEPDSFPSYAVEQLHLQTHKIDLYGHMGHKKNWHEALS